MKRYKVKANIYVDAESDDEAESLVTSMLSGQEIMSRMVDVESVEFQWEHTE